MLRRSNTKQLNINEKLDAWCLEYIQSKFLPEVRCVTEGLCNTEMLPDGNIVVTYPRAFDDLYLRPQILLEIGAKASSRNRAAAERKEGAFLGPRRLRRSALPPPTRQRPEIRTLCSPEFPRAPAPSPSSPREVRDPGHLFSKDPGYRAPNPLHSQMQESTSPAPSSLGDAGLRTPHPGFPQERTSSPPSGGALRAGAGRGGRDSEPAVEVEARTWTRILPVKNPPASARDTGNVGLIPGPGRSPGGGFSNPLQYSCLENSMDRGAWQATDRKSTR